MRYINMLVRKYGDKKTGLILYFIGALIGILVSNVFKGFYWDEIDLLNINYFEFIKNMEIDYKILRNYVLWKDFRNYILIWGLCFTKIGVGYVVLMILYYGFQTGFFLSTIFVGYGIKGILLIIGYTFPQFIIYVPVIVLSLQGGYWLCSNLYSNGIHKKNRVEVLGKYLVFILILAILLFIGALLETYVGSFVLVKMLSGFY